MATFVLVHGAWHGSWCWDRLVPELEAAGHRAITLDLPSEDPAATFETYADAVAEKIDDDTIVVGHSLAGLTIPLAAARRAPRHLVYLCGLVPIPGVSLVEQLQREPDMLGANYTDGLGDDAEGRGGWEDLDLARHFMYADCTDEDAEVALTRLRRQALSPYPVPCPLDAFPDVPATYVVCTEDRLVNPDWSRRVASERLGAEVTELPGSHSPFWSRPEAVARVLNDVAG